MIIGVQGSGSIYEEETTQISVEFTLSAYHGSFQVEVLRIDHPDALAAGLERGARWRLKGTTTDGINVMADGLMCLSVGSRILLLPTTGIMLGTSSSNPCIEARYPLTGSYDLPDVSVEVDGWTVDLTSDGSRTGFERYEADRVGRAIEGKTLTLRRDTEVMQGYWEKARRIATILALAAGQGVTAHRQFYRWEDDTQLEIWRSTSGDQIGPGLLIPAEYVAEFVRTALASWESWNDDKQDLVSVAIQYLNLSHNGMLDTRILQVVQVLESFADAWAEEQELSEELRTLKAALKATWRSWRDQEGEDDAGFWASRISEIFTWEKLRLRLEALLKSRRLDMQALGLNLDDLKEARDSVAHGCVLPERIGGDTGLALRTLLSGQQAIRLLLLVEIGYGGDLMTVGEGNWRNRKAIDSFFL